MHVVMTNPPFGSGIPITDPNILRSFELAYVWERTEDGGFRNTGRLQGSMAPEVLFIERCYQWLEPGGRTCRPTTWERRTITNNFSFFTPE
jgi:type I restriction enzyme M protein